MVNFQGAGKGFMITADGQAGEAEVAHSSVTKGATAAGDLTVTS